MLLNIFAWRIMISLKYFLLAFCYGNVSLQNLSPFLTKYFQFVAKSKGKSNLFSAKTFSIVNYTVLSYYFIMQWTHTKCFGKSLILQENMLTETLIIRRLPELLFRTVYYNFLPKKIKQIKI